MSNSTNNGITIFSNGQAHIQTYRKIKSCNTEQEFTLPFKAGNIEDVLASFTVFGDVTYTKPASFIQHSKSSINLNGSTFDTLASFRGTKIKFQYSNKIIEGTLFGTDTNREITAGGTSNEKRFITVMTADGMETIPWVEVKKFEFTDAEIKSEIEKALTSYRRNLKPEIVFLNIGLKPNNINNPDDTIVNFQWVEQLSPWSLSYRFAKTETSCKLDAFSVIHNATDTDWNDTIFTFVTGKPLTFISDLDKQRDVTRNKINIHESTAQGGYVTEDGIATSNPSYVSNSVRMAAAPSNYRMESRKPAVPSNASVMSNECFETVLGGGFECARPPQKALMSSVATTEEIGDFCVYKQDTPLNVQAGTTATMPLFSCDLSDAKSILVYMPKNNDNRPFRTIMFTNNTDKTLGKGVAMIFEKDLFQGKCVLNASKPGESRMLCYAEETGVSIKTTTNRNKDNLDRLVIANGVAVNHSWQATTTQYTIQNIKNEKFTIFIDYDKKLASTAKCVCTVDDKDTINPIEELNSGVRYSISLSPKSVTQVTVIEKRLDSQSVEINNNIDWFVGACVAGDYSVFENKDVKEVIAAKNALDSKIAEIASSNAKIDKANKLKTTITQVLGLGENAGSLAEYQDDLKKAINVIKTEGNTVEKLNEELSVLKTNLHESISKLSGEWRY